MTWNLIELLDANIYKLHAFEEHLQELMEDNKLKNTILLARITPGISISANQNFRLDIDYNACVRDGVDVTRRHSGGRSMYMDQDHLIISILRNDHEKLNIEKTYTDALNMVIETIDKITGKEFKIRGRDDLVVDGKKIGGASQKHSANYSMVHCYVRINNDIDKMLKYVMIDGHKLNKYAPEIKEHVTSIHELIGMEYQKFYESFKNELFNNVKYNMIDPSVYSKDLSSKINIYSNSEYIAGKPSDVSKGNCDIIVGSGTNAKLLIKSLEGIVKYS